MNSDIIDGLSDDEIILLYEDTIVDGLENGVHTGGCSCKPSSGTMVVFGNFAEYGGCDLLRNYLPDRAACANWCVNYHRLSHNAFYTGCWCRKTGQSINTAFGGFYAC